MVGTGHAGGSSPRVGLHEGNGIDHGQRVEARRTEAVPDDARRPAGQAPRRPRRDDRRGARDGQSDNSGNLSNVPLHLADVGTDNFDQEFTLSMIENEQETLDQIEEALGRIDAGTFGKCEECGGTVAKPRLQALPYTRIASTAPGRWRPRDEPSDRRLDRPAIPAGRVVLFWTIALAGRRVRPGDEGVHLPAAGRAGAAMPRTRSSRTSSSCRPATTPGRSGGSCGTSRTAA